MREHILPLLQTLSAIGFGANLILLMIINSLPPDTSSQITGLNHSGSLVFVTAMMILCGLSTMGMTIEAVSVGLNKPKGKDDGTTDT